MCGNLGREKNDFMVSKGILWTELRATPLTLEAQRVDIYAELSELLPAPGTLACFSPTHGPDESIHASQPVVKSPVGCYAPRF